MSNRYADSPDPGHYNHTHRALLQAFLSQSVMTFDELKPVIAEILIAHEPDREILVNDITQQTVTSMVQTINAHVNALDYEIRSTRNQNNRNLTYALVNGTSDPLTQIATSFTPDEIAYIKRLLDFMFETNNTKIREVMAVKGLKAVQLAKAPPRNRQSQAAGDGDGDEESMATQAGPVIKSVLPNDAEKVLSQLVVQGFFDRSHAGYYSLAPRALMELRTYLKETYNEPPGDEDEDDEPVTRIRDCEGCREIVTVGLRCDNKECGVRWHDHCAMQYFRNQQGSRRRCPKCKAEWEGETYVGEKADQAGGRRRTTNGQSSMIDEDDE
ncbi:hypothetical protein DM02DRAFT_651302 [Periconia macrospinosa]|uniref:Non-structural maintenance of chromosomes element 1 homolog n=1 Tax=Periconia macrospinosa TaxID=97972 RepID=A0A2V1E2W0_9PLEO|nr:hypothetical protein DM02DRAFT_651302 [Periconia macrospinosa]